MPLTADSPQMTSTTPFDPASATIAIVTYNRSGLLTRLLESIMRDGPEARARRDHRQRVGRTTPPSSSSPSATGSAPSSSTGASRRTPAAPAASARACASRTSSAPRGCGSWTTTSRCIPDGLAPHGRVGAALQEHPGPPLRLRRQRVLLAVPGRRAARHPDPVRARRLRRVRLQGDELRMLRGHVHPPRHRRSRSACPTRASSSTGTTRCTAGSPRARRRRSS